MSARAPSRRRRPDATTRVLVAIRRFVNRTGFDVVREDFRHRFVPALDRHGITTVLDVGANTGQFAAELRRARFPGAIVSVEPLAAAYAELAARAARDPSWTAERAAVSDRPGTVTMNVSANSVSSSVLPLLDTHADAAPDARYVGTEDVPATTVADLIARHGLDPARTLLKIDVQGYEQAVLDGAGEALDRLAGVRTELSLTPLYDGQALLPDIVTQLDKRGFDLWFLERGFTDPHTQRVLQVDGVFFRR